MDIPRQPEETIDVEADDLETVAKKLGVETSLDEETIVLKEKEWSYLNDERDADGNTLLMRFARLGKEDIVEFLLKCDGIRVNESNKEYDTAADIALSERKFGCLLKLLQGESEFPYIRDLSELQHAGLVEFIQQRQKLHECIQSGDLISVKELTENHTPSTYLSRKFEPFCKNQSALSWAAECSQLEVFAYLLNHGAKFKDSKEEKNCTFDDRQREKLNDLLDEYFVKIDDSHLLKLMHSSHSPQGFNDERKANIRDIYERLNESHLIRLIMKVLEHEDFDVVFDFESEYTDRLYCTSCRRIYGFTVPRIRRIFVGAGGCRSDDAVNRDVAGTLAHELCHLAMQVLYRNDAKPYEVGERTDYDSIVRKMHEACKDKPEDIDPVIRTVYNDESFKWHAELIVRVPHVLAIHGDKEGKALLQEQAEDLLRFYSERVVPKCESYADPAFFKRRLCVIESLHKYHGCVQDPYKDLPPLKEPYKSFKDCSIRKGNLSVVVTNNAKLCCLQIYHELKKLYKSHLEKQCLFFRLECFESNWKKILDAFRCKACRYIVLVAEEKTLDFDTISKDFDDVEGCRENTDGNGCKDVKKVVLIVGEECKTLEPDCRKNVLRYHWSDLSKGYEYSITHRMVNFKGKETSLTRWIDKEKIQKIIQSEDMLRLTNSERIELGNGMRLISRGYDRNFYMDRQFVKVTVLKSVFEKSRESTALYVTGLRKEDVERFGIDQGQIEWIDECSNEIDARKRIFILPREVNGLEYFDKLSRNRLSGRSVFWLHYTKEEFHLRMSNGSARAIKRHLKEEEFSERQLVEASNGRVVLISDDPGMGKSTALTELIRIIMEDHSDWWVGRVDLNDYADGKDNPLGLANIDDGSKPDDVLNIFVRMVGMTTSLEAHLFQKFITPRGLKREYHIFFDGFDEVASSYRNNALKLFRCLVEETTLRVWVATRRHEKLILETEFDTFSFSLKKLVVDDRARLLDRLWKYKMKSLDVQDSEEECSRATQAIEDKVRGILSENEDADADLSRSLGDLNGELEKTDSKATSRDKLEALRKSIDGLNFTRSARWFLEEVAKQDDELTSIPLNLFVMGNVLYDKNLKRVVYSNIHGLYSDFVEGNLRVYWRDKCKVTETPSSEELREVLSKIIADFHVEVAKRVVDPEEHRWEVLLGSGVGKVSGRVGMVAMATDRYQFIHRTLAEYFYAEWILEAIETRKLEAKRFTDALLGKKYRAVLSFLDGAVRREGTEVVFEKGLLDRLNLAQILEAFVFRASRGDFVGRYVLRKVLESVERVCDPSSVDAFVSKASEIFHFNELHEPGNVLQLLSFCLSDGMLYELFHTRIQSTRTFVVALFRQPAREVASVLEVYERVFRFKSIGTPPPDWVGEERFGLFDVRDRHGDEILHCAVTNPDAKVFLQVMEFAKRILGEERARRWLLHENSRGNNILHKVTWCGRRDVTEVLLEIQSTLDARACVQLLRQRDKFGNFLIFASRNRRWDCFEQVLRYLSQVDPNVVDGNELVREMLTEGDATDKNVLHWAAGHGETDTFNRILDELRKYSRSDEELAEFASRCDEDGRTVLHFRALEGHPIRDLSALRTHLGGGQFRELIFKGDLLGETCFHLLMKRATNVCGDIRFVSEVLDTHSLERLFMATDVGGNVFLRWAPRGSDAFAEVSNELRRVLPEASFRALVDDRRNRGRV